MYLALFILYFNKNKKSLLNVIKRKQLGQTAMLWYNVSTKDEVFGSQKDYQYDPLNLVGRSTPAGLKHQITLCPGYSEVDYVDDPHDGD